MSLVIQNKHEASQCLGSPQVNFHNILPHQDKYKTVKSKQTVHAVNSEVTATGG